MEQSYSGKIFSNLLAITFFLALLFYGMPESKFTGFRLILFSIVCLFIIYMSLDNLFSKVVISNHGVIEKNHFPFYREKVIPYNSITHIYRRLSRTGWRHYIESKEETIIISDYSRWKDCLREISQRVDIKLFDLNVQKSIGLRQLAP